MTTAQTILAKAPLPTHLDSKEIRERIAADILQRSIFSAKTTELGYLQRLQEMLARLASGQINQADFVAWSQRYLDGIGYNPANEGAEPNSLQDRASEARLKLIRDTVVRQAENVARSEASNDPDILAAYPAWRLTRVGSRIVPRDDWWQRWQDAGNSVNWEGASKTQQVALKSSPIWAAIGAGQGGYSDTLGTAYPPFAFGSGLGWVDVSAAGAKQLGLVWQGEDVATASLKPDVNEYQAAYDRLSPELRAEAKAWLEGVA